MSDCQCKQNYCATLLCSQMFTLCYISVISVSLSFIQHSIETVMFDTHGLLQLTLSTLFITRHWPHLHHRKLFQEAVWEVWRSSFQQHDATEVIMPMIWMDSSFPCIQDVMTVAIELWPTYVICAVLAKSCVLLAL